MERLYLIEIIIHYNTVVKKMQTVNPYESG